MNEKEKTDADVTAANRVRKESGDLLRENDGTGRDTAEERLAHLATFPQLNPNPVLGTDVSGNLTFVNSATKVTLESLGLSLEDARAFIPPDLPDVIAEWDRQRSLTVNREVTIKDRTFSETICLVPRLNVALIYTHDITERKLAERALRESEQMYRAIGESIDFGTWICAPDGRNIYASESFLKLVGMTQEQCSNFGWGDVLHPDDAERTIAAWKECVRTGGAWDIEHRFRGTDGQWHPILARGVPVRDEEGRVKCWAGINLDIQRLKQTEQALTESEERLRIFVGHAPAAIAMLDNDLRYISASRRWFSDYGLDERDIIGLNHYEVFPDIPERWKETLHRCLAGAVERNDADPWVRADGHTEWVRWEVRPWYKSSNTVGGLVIFSENINDFKAAEDALRKSEEKYRLLFRNMAEGFALYELLFDDGGRPVDWRVLEVNDAYEQHTGISRGKIVGRCISEVFPDAVSQYLPIFARVVADQRAEDFETYVKHTGRWLHVVTFPAGLRRFASTITDITARRQAGEALRKMNDELEARVNERTAQVSIQAKEIGDLYNNAPCGYHSLDGNGVVININDTELQWLGYSRGEVVGIRKFTDFLTPRSRNVFAENFPKFLEQGWIRDLEFEVIRKDGSTFIALLSAAAVCDSEGNFAVSRSTMFDISSRKENERKIIATNDLLKLFSSAPTCDDYLNDAAGLIKKWSRCFCVGICLHNEDGKTSRGAYAGVAREVWEKEVCLFEGKGACRGILNNADTPECHDSSCIACNGMFVCNDSSHVLSPESGLAARTLMERAEELGFLSVAIMPVRYREKMLGSIHLADRRKNAIPRQTTELMELITPLIGEAIFRFSVEESLMVSREQLRNLSLHLLTAREEERTLVAREIHDELGQTLTAARIELSLLKKTLQKKDIAEKKLQSAMDLIDSAVEDVHKICTELRPRMLDHLGLEAAMEWQAKRFSDSAGLNCFLEFPPQHVTLPTVVAIAMFRIFQEALTNVVRHAQATSVFVRLAVEEDTIMLVMTDNGKGISPQDIAKMTSFGVTGMRERARELGGDCVFTSDNSKGTTVTVTIPLGKGRAHVQNSDSR